MTAYLVIFRRLIAVVLLVFQSAAAMSQEELAMALDTPGWGWTTTAGSYGPGRSSKFFRIDLTTP